jgi:predicted dehydrogenase
VVGVSGRTAESAADAARELEQAHGIRARAYGSVEALLAAERLDVLVVATPAERHLRDLRAALAARVHVLSEKPLCWSEDALDAPARLRDEASALVRGFAAAGLALALNAQWPWTLGAFAALYPDAPRPGAWRERPPGAVAMRLSPLRGGLDMVIESGSHLLSLLAALAGPGRVEGPEVRWADGGEAAEVRFVWRTEGAAAAARLELRTVPAQPRPAWIEVDGRRAERDIELASYAMRFRAPEGRAVPLADPLELRVADFVRDLGRPGGPTPADPAALLADVDGLLALALAARAALASR